MRKNGWEAPFHYLQLITWVFFPTIMACFFAFYTPFLALSTAYMGTAAYTITCGVVIYSVIRCTGTDPSDDSILRANDTPDTCVREDQVYCNVCQQNVHKESRHCRLCDKCVAVFDHHCKWLNNCVGKKNYAFFLTSVIGATIMLGLQVAFGTYVLWTTYSSTDVIKKRSATAYGCSASKAASGLCMNDNYHFSIIALRIIHIVLLAFLVPWTFLIAQLAAFHFQLCIENITTYDYIVRKRKRKLQRERENAVRLPWWKLLLARLCCQQKDLGENHKSGEQSQSVSRLSDQISEDDEQAAIEAEVDEDLEILSARSGENGDRRGSQSFRASKSGQPPARGFGRHIDLGQNGTTQSDDMAILVQTPVARESADYLMGPNTPRSPRSDPSSAYVSDSSDADRDRPPLRSSVVMYGRPTENRGSHIV